MSFSNGLPPGVYPRVAGKCGLVVGHDVSASVLVHAVNHTLGNTKGNHALINFRLFSVVVQRNAVTNHNNFVDAYTIELTRLTFPRDAATVLAQRTPHLEALLTPEYVQQLICVG